MKKSKISLVASLLLVSNVYAFNTDDHNIKISGNLKLWYQTMDHGGVDGEKGLFRFQDDDANTATRNEWGNVSAQIRMTGEASNTLSYGATVNGVTSMGFNGHLTSAETTRTNDTEGSTAVETGREQIPFWFHEIFAIYKTGNTSIKLGRQELDTPFAYTEKWNATSNSFEAVVVTNTDLLKDTTVQGMWVSKGNGANNSLMSAPQVFGAENTFNNYMSYEIDGEAINAGGMLVLGAKNNSIKSVPVQLWYYNTLDVMQAWWLQADTKTESFGPLKDVSLNLIGAGIGLNSKIEKYVKNGAFGNTNTKTDDTVVIAGKASAKMGIFSTYVAGSQTSEGNLPVANTATNYKKTKLPTASIFNDGMVAAQPDTTAFKIGAGMKIGQDSSLGLSYGSYNVGQNTGYFQPNINVGGPASIGYLASRRGEDMSVSEVDFVLKTKYKDIDIKAMYIYLDQTYVPGTDNSVDSYGSHDNHIIRIVATLNF